MKKLLLFAAFALLLVCAYCAGRRAGVDHALYDCAVSIDWKYKEPQPYDADVLIELDGETYVHCLIPFDC